MMAHELSPYAFPIRQAGGSAASVLFGYRIPHLPDLLADHTLLGGTEQQRLDEVLSRWTQFIVGLRKWPGSAYALRFYARPAAGAIDIVLLCRLASGSPGQAELTPAVIADLSAQLTTIGLPHEPLAEPALQSALFPFAGRPNHLVEVRQHEEVTKFLITRDDAYVTHPFWTAGGSWLLPFEAMLRQPADTVVSLFLQPTSLSPQESDSLAAAAQIAATLAQQQMRTHSDQTVAQWRDPQAELVSRIYGAVRNQMREAYLALVQVASPDASTAWTMARVLGAAITARQGELAVDGGERALPSAFDLRYPRDQTEEAMARRCFTYLEFAPWGNEMATPGKERLVYLAGSQGAAAVFRLPVSVRGGVPGVTTRQSAPDFEPGPRPAAAAPDEIHLGEFRRGGAVTAPFRQLTRHTLITGFTGAGKTNTVLYLLDQLWKRRRIPFLVVEAAKKEYRGLLEQPGFEELLVFTLGDETTSPFRLNPFELLPGVRLEAHLGRLQACFDAALPQFGILPSIIAESLELIYSEKGWQLTDRGENADRLFPTMRDILRTVIQVAETRGYAGETYHNIRAAAAGRIGSLLRGSRGRMFDCQRSAPADLLMSRPVILELNDLNQDDKALTMMFLLTWLREYRELHRAKGLQHVTVVEEAHNVMANVQSVGASEIAADTRAKAVEAFSGMLAEVRAYGEGLIISDQSPDKLAPDAVRNTNLQIAHQLRHRVDREAIAAAMIMSEAQQEFLGKLRVGEAAVFQTGYDRATFMRVPNYKDDNHFGEPDDAAVAARMEAFQKEHRAAYLPFDGCRFCGSPCAYRESVEPQTRNVELVEQFKAALKGFDHRPEPEHWPENWRGVAGVCAAAARIDGRRPHVDAAWCYLAHEIDFAFTEHMRGQFVSAFKELW
jgi:hypothetical protein